MATITNRETNAYAIKFRRNNRNFLLYFYFHFFCGDEMKDVSGAAISYLRRKEKDDRDDRDDRLTSR